MRRIVIAILVFASLGLAATVGIAWWLAIDLQRSTFLNAGDYPLVWQYPGVLVQRNDARPPDVRERGENLEYERLAAEFDAPYWSELNDVPDDGTRRVVEVATGWPLKTLRMVGEGEGSFTESVDMNFRGALIGDLAMSRFGRNTMPITRLPVRPIWVNLLLSVFVWAALCALVLNVPRFVRVIRWNLRREKKKCGWCGHDPRMQRSEVCTECGNELDTPPRWLGGPSIVGAVLLLTVLLSVEAMMLVQFLSHQPVQDIHWVAARGDVDGVRKAIEGGTDIDAQIAYYDAPEREHSLHGTTALLIANRNDNLEIVNALLEEGADPNVPAATRVLRPPIVEATERGNEAIALSLLIAGANPLQASRNYNVLSAAATNNDMQMVNLLLQSKAGENIPAGFLEQALVTAARRGRTSIVEALLGHGAPITWNVMNAGVQGTWETLQVLIKGGGDLTARSDNGRTLLFQVTSSDPRIWQALLDAGIEIDAISPRDGQTALLDAVEAANADFVEFLLEAGADPSVRDNEGRDALDIVARVRPYRWRVRSIERIEQMLTQYSRPRTQDDRNVEQDLHAEQNSPDDP